MTLDCLLQDIQVKQMIVFFCLLAIIWPLIFSLNPLSADCLLANIMEFPNKLSGGHYHGIPQLSKTGQNAIFPKLSGGHYHGIPQLSKTVAKMPFSPNFPGLEKGTQFSPNFPKLLKAVRTLRPLWLHAHRMDGCGQGWGWCLTCHRMAWVLLASISDCNVEQKKPSTGSRTTLKLYICKHTTYNI